MNIFKTLAVTTPLAISAFALTGCHNHNHDHDGYRAFEEQTNFENYSTPLQQERQVYNENDSSRTTQQERPDYRNPNLPRISSNLIQYRNLSGNVVNVKVVDNATVSLYKAIQKYSNANSPDIKDIGGFYADVESNISKNQRDKTDRPTVYASNYHVNGQSVIALRHLQCSIMFNKLFDIFTSPKSEGGENITVNEYTKMMDAWSSTGVRSNH